MYSSYGSYSSSASSSRSSSYGSSYSSISRPMDISPINISSSGADASCAFPSWPRRTSLCESESGYERPTSFLSDEDLMGDVFDDDVRSISSTGSSPMHSPPKAPFMTEAEILEMQREQAAYQREMVSLLVREKERRKAQAKRQRSAGKASSKKSTKSKLSAMTPIAESE
ncbi:hypothetical protein QBC45DRAFT_427126 [Copromyces sp. CBS 386.78]|nr:hypothetical protein QBC45DRAFT_427126 [Copromyces sp. CBS 386.78]